jgi:hypothetical protein
MPGGGAKPGERRGGRPKNGRNKATIAKLHDEAIVKRVAKDIGADRAMVNAALERANALNGFRAKNELIELAMAMKNHLVQFQQAATALGAPGTPNYSAALWREVREWGKFYKDLCDTVADFGPDARIKTIEFFGHVKTEDITPVRPGDDAKIVRLGSPQAASRAYQQFITAPHQKALPPPAKRSA